MGSATVALTVLTWQVSRGGERLGLFILEAIATSIAYSFWLVCNHDATHRTLTGWDWFDGVMLRLIFWPMLLPVGTYNQIHRLHHYWNGIVYVIRKGGSGQLQNMREPHLSALVRVPSSAADGCSLRLSRF
ncbi:MAG: fatty acid desaturase [Cyanobacteria bacterium J06621_11]